MLPVENRGKIWWRWGRRERGACIEEINLRPTDATVCGEIVLDAIETESVETTQPATPGALRTAGVRTNRFFSLATDSDQEEQTSDTVCLPERSVRRRRLHLRWNPDNAQQTATQVDPLDSHDQRLEGVRRSIQEQSRERKGQHAVRVARGLMRSLAE